MAGQMIQLTLQFIAVCSLSKLILSVKECKKIDECRCSTDEGEINLQKVAGTGGEPRYKDWNVIGAQVSTFNFPDSRSSHNIH